jgi:hypothetical protein
MEYIRPAIYVLLGWMLGLLSPHLVDLILRPYRRNDLKRSIFIEIEDLKPKLALKRQMTFSPVHAAFPKG